MKNSSIKINPLPHNEKVPMKKEVGQLSLDIYHTKDEIVILAPIAGVEKDDISISITEDVLVIKGERETREEISLITNDEFTEVIEYLRQMQEKLEDAKISLEIKVKARTEELGRLTEQQEEIIQERVKEIQKRAEDMERFQKLAVGRELKMIELKREIEKLKEELKKGRK